MKGDNGLYYSYNSVFSEYTTKGQGISCSNYANCYIGCTCRSGWNKRSASASDIVDGGSLKTAGAKAVSTAGTKANVSTMAEGDSCTVSITDPRYGTTCSISTTKDCAGVCDGSAYFRCTSGSTSSYCPSGQYSVYLGKQQCSSGSATNSTSCYTCRDCSYSCPNGYYTSAGSGYYLTSTSKYQVCNGDSSQTNSTKCYTRATCSYSCPSGYATSAGSGYYLTSNSKYQVCNGDSSQTNSTKCYERKACSYSCPSGYYTSAGTGYHLTNTYEYQVCDGDSSKTNSTKCYTREADTCAYKGYVDACPTGQTGKAVTINSGSSTKTCYTDCKEDIPEYYVSVRSNSSGYSVSGEGYYKSGSKCTVRFEDDDEEEYEGECCWYDGKTGAELKCSSNCSSGSYSFTVTSDSDIEFEEKEEEDNEPPYFTVSKAGSLTGISDITSITVKLSKSYPSDIHCTLNFSGFSGSQMNERFYMGPLNVTVPANTTSKSVSVNMRSLNINCPVGNGGFDDCSAGYIMLDYDTYCDNAAISYDLQDIITRGANTASSREFNDIVHEYILNF